MQRASVAGVTHGATQTHTHAHTPTSTPTSTHTTQRQTHAHRHGDMVLVCVCVCGARKHAEFAGQLASRSWQEEKSRAQQPAEADSTNSKFSLARPPRRRPRCAPSASPTATAIVSTCAFQSNSNPTHCTATWQSTCVSAPLCAGGVTLCAPRTERIPPRVQSLAPRPGPRPCAQPRRPRRRQYRARQLHAGAAVQGFQPSSLLLANTRSCAGFDYKVTAVSTLLNDQATTCSGTLEPGNPAVTCEVVTVPSQWFGVHFDYTAAIQIINRNIIYSAEGSIAVSQTCTNGASAGADLCSTTASSTRCLQRRCSAT